MRPVSALLALCVNLAATDLPAQGEAPDDAIMSAFADLVSSTCSGGELAARAVLDDALACAGENGEFYSRRFDDRHTFWIQHGVSIAPLAPLREAGISGADLVVDIFKANQAVTDLTLALVRDYVVAEGANMEIESVARGGAARILFPMAYADGACYRIEVRITLPSAPGAVQMEQVLSCISLSQDMQRARRDYIVVRDGFQSHGAEDLLVARLRADAIFRTLEAPHGFVAGR